MSKHNLQIQSFAGALLKESVGGNFGNVRKILNTIPKYEHRHLLIHLCISIFELFEEFKESNSKILDYLNKIQTKVEVEDDT
jgi:hypothetical protein